MASAELQALELSKLDLQHLRQLKIQVDNELYLLQDCIHSLKIATNKFLSSKKALVKLMPKCIGSEIMVPLSSSVYVPGRIAGEKLLLDIGTGYFIQKGLEDAKDYFERKLVFLSDQTEKMQAIGLEKTQIREVLMEIIRMKLGEGGVNISQGPTSSNTQG